jgi:RNA polymerase sigma factor for flagellar operon FliA
MMENGSIEDDYAMVRGLAGRLFRELSLRGELDDLVAFGFGGLLEAKRRFDPSRGVRFKSYAYHRVRGAMLDGVRKMAGVPRRAHAAMQEASAVQPSAAPSGLDKAFGRIRVSLSSDAPLQGRFGEESPEEALIKQQSIQRVLKALQKLPERQRRVIRGWYFEGRRLDDVAQELGISKSWASRLHHQALDRLRASLSST